MAISRRNLLTTAAASAVVAGGLIPGIKAKAQPLPGWTSLVRRDVNTLAPDDPLITSYRYAVGQMRALPAANPLSWDHQAQIHADYCPHGNWFFLPWHRAYLHQFEEIIRVISGNNFFTLPYWDWTRNPQIPPAFWGAGNPLSHSRNADQATNMPSEFTGAPVISRVMENTDFESFGSYKSSSPYNGTGGGYAELEGTPHNRVHSLIGGDMVTLFSPRDPIFWLHHCNIDRIWASWTFAGNTNTGDPDLADYVFVASQPSRSGTVNPSQFVDRNGNARVYRIRDVYVTGAMGYVYDRYEDAPQTSFAVAARSRAERRVSRSSVDAPLKKTASAGAALSTSLVVQKEQTEEVAATGRARQLSRIQSAPVRALPEIETATLKVFGLKGPEDPATSIRVFLNCDYLTVDTPINDPHYVASAAFFLARSDGTDAADDHQEHRVPAYVFDLTETIDALKRAGRDLGGNLTPQIIALNPDGSGAELEIDGKLEITFETAG